MKTELHACFLLHSRPYRETSLLLDVFSSQYGRVNLVARGAKRRNNNQSLLLQTGRKLNISWSMKRELGTMISVEANGPCNALKGTRLISCFYMNELLVRMLHRDESHPELFNIYDESMLQLNSKCPEDRVLRIFEKHLLKSLGYGLNLEHDMESGDNIVSEVEYFYRIDSGPVRKKPKNVKYVSISGKTLCALAKENDWSIEISRESKALFRRILAEYTGDKPLGSRELYKAYIAQSLTI
ncbi:MAG: DNA repair protein RecO (recombination protein O) [Gammaproteobacteria bacterium]|jgi:DNA repair protein RecO (recombination protein O)